MKRSQINSIIREMEELIRQNGFHLPPFCNWTPNDWKSKGMNMMRFVTIC